MFIVFLASLNAYQKTCALIEMKERHVVQDKSINLYIDAAIAVKNNHSHFITLLDWIRHGSGRVEVGGAVA